MERPQILVRRLARHFKTDMAIVDALAEIGVKTSQPTINRLRHGKGGRTSFELGVGLNRLHEKVAHDRNGAAVAGPEVATA